MAAPPRCPRCGTPMQLLSCWVDNPLKLFVCWLDHVFVEVR